MFGKGAPGTKRLCALYALNAAALGLWSVNFPSVLKAHGLESLVPYTFACNASAALLSPLAVGALADQRMAPERVLRLLGWVPSSFSGCCSSAFSMAGLLARYWLSRRSTPCGRCPRLGSPPAW